MSQTTVVTCDHCGKEINRTKDLALQVIELGRGDGADNDGDYCDFHCLLLWIIKYKPGAMRLYERHDAPVRPVKDVPQA